MKHIFLNIHNCLLALMTALVLTGCTNDDIDEGLTAEQQSLIGRAVNFNASVADVFTTRVSYEHNGVFNDDDIMVIYRQYYNDDTKSFDWTTEDFHTYYYRRKYASGSTNISLGREWQVAFSTSASDYLHRLMGRYSSDGADGRTLTKQYQEEKDSITWENGKTLRYRAWSRSNQSNVLRNGSKSTYYPDFEISDWVNVSGPTNEIPLTLRHIGSRIMFSHKNMGNQLSWAEICTAPEDYERIDNADNLDNDAADRTYPKSFTVNGETVTVNNATEAANAVKAVYERMCMPAGIDLEKGTLKSMTKAAYDATDNFSKIEEWEFDDTKKSYLVEFNKLSAEDIKNNVQRPVFTGSVNSRLHLITIPYDMSTGDTNGDIIVLPPWTRIRVWLYDVNGGDKYNTDHKRESEYHIFSLDDIKRDDETAYPNGLEMRPGYSYEFVVGYRYNQLTITPGENISWIDQDEAIAADAVDDTQSTIATGNYAWWKNAIRDAIPRANEPYAPEFHITNEAQFVEFINLVNGNAGEYGRQHPIYRLVKEYTTVTNTNGTISKVPKTYGWSRVNSEKDAVWVEKDVLEAEGYIFYEHYHPAEGDKAAYSVEDYLQSAYNFYDEGLTRTFTVYLDRDLDFKDVRIDAVGTSTNPFRGFFEGAPEKVVQLDGDGNMMFTSAADPRIAYNDVSSAPVAHTIRNLNVNGGYLFGYVRDSAIRNLMLRSYHTIGLLNTAIPSRDGDKVTGWGCNIVGISVKANNTTANHNAIAKSLTGLSYVVGCIHEGDATGALVGTADNMTMYGCMRTADNISGGALLGAYANAGDKYLAPAFPQKPYSNKPTWSRFMCNYYNKDIREASKDATAIGSIADDYSVWYYIRGRASRILCAQNDNLVDKKVGLSQLTDQQVQEFYGLAPWKAMNYAIYKYNTDTNYPGKNGHECRVRYQVGTTGYDHTYPQLVSGKPGVEASEWNVLIQSN